MKTLEQGSQKIKKISELLKSEVIEPAKKEAQGIIEEAKAKAEEMIHEAQKEITRLHQEFKTTIEQERNVFQSTMNQASRLTIETLKQEIVDHLFNKEFHSLIEKETKDPTLVAKMIDAMIKAIDKEGLSANLSAVIPKTVSDKEVNALLGDQILKKLKEHSVILGDFVGGAKVKMHDKNMTIEMTDEALMELVASFAPAFRKSIFAK